MLRSVTVVRYQNSNSVVDFGNNIAKVPQTCGRLRNISSEDDSVCHTKRANYKPHRIRHRVE